MSKEKCWIDEARWVDGTPLREKLERQRWECMGGNENNQKNSSEYAGCGCIMAFIIVGTLLGIIFYLIHYLSPYF